jgi:ATP-dependent RNA helicase DeaD
MNNRTETDSPDMEPVSPTPDEHTPQPPADSSEAAAPGAPEPRPTLFRFEDLSSALQQRVAALGWREPMEVQARTIPLLRRGLDLIVQSRTGSGKTGAFLLPMLMDLDPEASHCQALVLVPTRELAIQVHNEFLRLTEAGAFRGALLYGGVGYGKQLRDLEQGAHVVIGTPGRILDHLDRGTFRADRVRMLVLDEADEMLSMGFYPAMRRVRRWLPARRQSLMFSATMPQAVIRLSKEFLHQPEFLSLSGDHVGVDTLTHEYYLVPPMEKDRALVRLIEMENPSTSLIFCNRKSEVEYLYQFLQNAGYDVDRISGDLTQRAREEVMHLIREHKVRYLIATDVAARGIDIQDLEIVFQYDVPQDHEIYVHRAGRTARAGKSGRCITLATYMDEFQVRQIQSKFKFQIQRRELPGVAEVSARVCERTTVLLEEQLRDAGSVMHERIDRFAPLAAELAQSDEGRRLLSLLLDDYYHRSLHLPPRLPEERVRFEDMEEGPSRPRGASGERGRSGRDRDSRPRRERHEEAREERTPAGGGANAEAGSAEEGERPRKRRRRRRPAEGGAAADSSSQAGDSSPQAGGGSDAGSAD